MRYWFIVYIFDVPRHTHNWSFPNLTERRRVTIIRGETIIILHMSTVFAWGKVESAVKRHHTHYRKATINMTCWTTDILPSTVNTRNLRTVTRRISVKTNVRLPGIYLLW